MNTANAYNETLYEAAGSGNEVIGLAMLIIGTLFLTRLTYVQVFKNYEPPLGYVTPTALAWLASILVTVGMFT